MRKNALRSKPAVMTLADCPVNAALAVLRGKWKPLLLYFLKAGPRRYGELRRALTDASEKVLTQQLRQLERDRIVARVVYPGAVSRVEYDLTPHGQTLVDVLDKLAAWAERHRQATMG